MEDDHRDDGEATTFQVFVNDRSLPAQPGDTVAAVLLANGMRVLRRTAGGAPRGLYCVIGICQECLVTVDSVPARRACMTLAEPGQRIQVPDA
jgi:aerobic-type carbon monoxide dehydrogenase small subunit (CoxS/CutS family)